MDIEFHSLVEIIGKAVEFIGVIVLAACAILFTVWLLYKLAFGGDRTETYHTYRRILGRGILAGLELLVAGDIIRTVGIAPTFESLGVLAGIVLIRTFLSFTLELEITGKWPWEKG